MLLLPLVAVCVAVPASGQLPQIWPLDVTLTAERIGDKAAGAVTVINPTKGPIEVGKLIFRVLFFDEQRVQKDDIRQNLVVRKCGATKLPATLAPDDEVVCPFTTADNVYHGAIQITAGAVRATEPDDSFSGDALGMDMVDWLTPAGSDDAGGTDTIASSTNTGSLAAAVMQRLASLRLKSPTSQTTTLPAVKLTGRASRRHSAASAAASLPFTTPATSRGSV